jgi:DNA polymerase I
MFVTAEHRRNAKAVNFGIAYGQTPFGLATSLGIDRKEAERYIRAYFERYAGVRRWLDQTVAEVRRTGVSVNMFGRHRPIPDMESRNPNARNFAERTAINTPLQEAKKVLTCPVTLRQTWTSDEGLVIRCGEW